MKITKSINYMFRNKMAVIVNMGVGYEFSNQSRSSGVQTQI